MKIWHWIIIVAIVLGGIVFSWNRVTLINDTGVPVEGTVEVVEVVE